MLEDPSVHWVAVNSPNAVHASQIIASLESGRHVFCEKPLAPKFEDCLKVRDALLRSGCKFFFGLVLRSSQFYRRIKELLDSGEIGEIISFEFNETLPFQHGGFIMGD